MMINLFLLFKTLRAKKELRKASGNRDGEAYFGEDFYPAVKKKNQKLFH